MSGLRYVLYTQWNKTGVKKAKSCYLQQPEWTLRGLCSKSEKDKHHDFTHMWKRKKLNNDTIDYKPKL